MLTGAAITSATPAPMTAADLQSSSDPVDYLIIARLRWWMGPNAGRLSPKVRSVQPGSGY